MEKNILVIGIIIKEREMYVWESSGNNIQGLMGWNNGEVYIGESQYGFQQGNGMMTYSNGDKYSKNRCV